MMKKHVVTFLLSSIGLTTMISQENYDYKIVPKIITIKDNVNRQILDYTKSKDIGMIEMIAPKDWTEPILGLNFETTGIVINGKLGLQFKNETLYFSKNEGFVIPKNKRVRIFNGGDKELRIIEIMRPAFQENLVQRFTSFE